jgi:WD40 repeat protein
LVTATSGASTHDSGQGLPGQLRVRDAGTGKLFQDLPGHNRGISHVSFNPDGRRLVSAGRDGTLKLWDPEHGQEVLTLRITCEQAEFDPRGERLLVGIWTGVQVWDGTPRWAR